MGITHIWPEGVLQREGRAVCSATVEVPGLERRVLSYELPEEHLHSVAPNCDHFVVGAVYMLMRARYGAYVHGEVSPSLLENIGEYMAARTLWRSHLSRVAIQADVEREPQLLPDRGPALVAYSGGVDSSFTVFRHSQGLLRVPRNVGAGVMVRGFDIPYGEEAGFLRAVERSRTMLESQGLDLIPVATNYRLIVPDHEYYESWGPAVASCLMALGGGFSAGLLSQSIAYDDLVDLDWGCNPLADRLLSSSSFEIIPDGAEVSRIEKIQTLDQWPEFRQFGRVCWQAPERDRNCCRCEKCIRTMLGFKVLGLPLPPCFPHDVGVDQIMNLDALTEKAMDTWYDSVLEAAGARGVDEPWTRALRERLRLNRKRRRSLLRRGIAKARRLAGRAKRVWR